MPLLVVGISVLVLLLLMTRLRLNGFAALLLVAVGVALVQGIPVATIPDVLSDGIGGQIGDTMLTIGLGAMVGRVMGDSGAAQRIAGKLLDAFGPRWVQVAMVVTAMLIGVTMFYEVAFIIIVPIAFTLVRVTGAPLLWVGLPMSITLSTMHSFLPPHPGPTAVAATFDASVGLTLLYGLFIAVPAGAFIALLWPRLDSPTARLTAFGAAALALVMIPLTPAGIPVLAAGLVALGLALHRAEAEDAA